MRSSTVKVYLFLANKTWSPFYCTWGDSRVKTTPCRLYLCRSTASSHTELSRTALKHRFCFNQYKDQSQDGVTSLYDRSWHIFCGGQAFLTDRAPQEAKELWVGMIFLRAYFFTKQSFIINVSCEIDEYRVDANLCKLRTTPVARFLATFHE